MGQRLDRSVQSRGFTLVELLIVIVVIAILAAISIVAYNGIQNRANDSAIKSDLRGLAMMVMEKYTVDGEYPVLGANSGNFPGGIKYSLNKGSYSDGVNAYYCVVPSGANARFTLAAMSKSGNAFVYSGGSISDYTGTSFTTGNGICPSTGIATTEPGYEYHYGRNTNGGWSAWTNG